MGITVVFVCLDASAPMSPHSSFNDLMNRLRSGEDAAAAQVFDQFARRLMQLARSHLDSWTRRTVDPEDIVQSVYLSFFQRVREGQFELVNWNSLWGILTCITLRKCQNRVEYLRAARRDVQREVSFEGVSTTPSGDDWQPLDREPTPDEAAILTETVEQVMRDLDERERTMVALSFQGYTVQEISPQVGRSERTVQRLLERVKRQLETMQAD